MSLNKPTLTAVDHDPFAGPALAAFVPSSESQREVWLATQFGTAGNLAYNEGLRIDLAGTLDEAALRHALQTVLDRHEALRASFSPDGQHLLIAESLPLDLPLRDLSSLPAEARTAELTQLCAQEMGTAFDVEHGPLLRFLLVRMDAQHHHLLFIAHHAICDGWSGAVVITELAALYSAQVEGAEKLLPAAARYGDYSLIERGFLDSDEGRKHLDYWLAQLKDAPPPPQLPTDLTPQTSNSLKAARLDLALDADLIRRLRATGSAHGASLVATMLASFAGLLYRFTGQSDLVIGLAAAGQSFHEQKMLVGHCVNLLPLRVKLDGAAPFTAALHSTRGAVLDAFDHQGVTFGSLLPRLELSRDDERPPLVSVVFNIDVRDDDIRHSGLEVAYHTLVRQAETFELFINVVDNGKSLVLEASYNTALYSEGLMQRYLQGFESLLRAVCDNTQTTLDALPLVGAEAREQLDDWNATAAPVPTAPLHALLLETARRRPSAAAVLFGDTQQSYGELNEASARIAQALRQHGAAPGRDVAVCLERSLLVPAALLGVLRSGAGYVALDPIFPTERVRGIVEQASVPVLLTNAALKSQFADLPCTVLCVEDLLASEVTIDHAALDAIAVAGSDAAYIVFTSGSTGQPKGVVLTHAGVVNCLHSLSREPGLGEQETALAVATLAFDFSVYEIFLPLLVGARLVVADLDSTSDGTRLKALIEQHNISSIHATPATTRLLQAADWPGKADLRMVFGGEPLPRDLVAWLLPRIASVWNIYGPTETTITSNLCRIIDAEGVIDVGGPIANVYCRVLDTRQQLLPPGVAGELYIGGAGVGRGYLNQPALTAERFIDDPYLPGGRLYRSGDLARWLTDSPRAGRIEILGRIDRQVKLRGYRVELGEIEHALTRHPDVTEALVAVMERSAGDQRLVAYFSLREGAEEPLASVLRNTLREHLPSYMVPQHFVALASLPRLANGKLDRKRLPDPFGGLQTATARIAPRTTAEHAVAEVWAELLGNNAISIDDRFGDLGGHSLLAVQAAARLQARFGIKPGLRSLMTDPLQSIAQQLGGGALQLPAAPAKAAVNAAASAASFGASAAGVAAAKPSSVSDIVVPARPKEKKSSNWLGRLFEP